MVGLSRVRALKIRIPRLQVCLPLHDKLNKRLSAIAIQLRTAKIGLKAFLYSRKAVESPSCPCRRGRQTVKHVLFECSKLKELRRGLWTDEVRKAK